MSKVRVVIATTEGPAEIDRITPEDTAQSVVCLRRSSQVLPISAGYDAFVRRPSGVIEREFPRAPPGAYRLDVSAPVTNGESWQLGVFVAHALAAEGRLAASGEACEAVVVATGRVDNDLRVQPVDRISEKAHALRPLLDELQARGVAVRLLVPPDNRAEFEAAGLPREIPLIAVADAWVACAEAGVDPPADRTVKRSGGRRTIAASAALAVLALAALVAAAGPERWTALVSGAPEPPIAPPVPATVAPAPPVPARAALAGLAIGSLPASLVVSELLPPSGATCPQVHMGSATAVAAPVPPASPQVLTPSRQKPVCGLRFTVTTGRSLHVALLLRVTAGRHVESQRKPALLDGATAFAGTQSWEIGLPPGQAFAYSIVMVAGEAPVSEFVRRAAADAGPPAAGPGMALLSLRHEVAP